MNNGNFANFDPRLVNTEINNTMLNTFNGSFMASHSKKMSKPSSKAKSVKRDKNSKQGPFKSTKTSKCSNTRNSNEHELVIDTKSMGTSTDPEEELAKSYQYDMCHTAQVNKNFTEMGRVNINGANMEDDQPKTTGIQEPTTAMLPYDGYTKSRSHNQSPTSTSNVDS